MRVIDLYESINKFAPFSLSLEYDNTGLLCGDGSKTVKKVMLSLDITLDVIREAKKHGAECIISHHPVIFEPLKSIPCNHPVYYLIKEDIAAICAHTNLDLAEGGVNDALAQALKLQDIKWLSQGNTQTLGRMGTLENEMERDAFLLYVKKNINSNIVRYNHYDGRVQRVAVIGGSGGSDYKQAMLCGCDALVTGEAKYNHFLEAGAENFLVVEAGHFATENVVLEKIECHLNKDFPDLNIIRSSHIDIIKGV